MFSVIDVIFVETVNDDGDYREVETTKSNLKCKVSYEIVDDNFGSEYKVTTKIKCSLFLKLSLEEELNLRYVRLNFRKYRVASIERKTDKSITITLGELHAA